MIKNTKQKSTGDQSPNITTDGDVKVSYGISFEKYKADLAEKEYEIRQLLVNVAIGEKEEHTLLIQLAEIEQNHLDVETSYQTHIKKLQERITRLDRLVGQVPHRLIEEAKQALASGDNQEADQLFSQVEDAAEPHIAAAAEAAYQRGELAENDIRYSDASLYYVRATQLFPDSPVYLNAAGGVYKTLGDYDHAIGYYERALVISLKAVGEERASVALYRNNLGSAWKAKGDYDQAISYYQQALGTSLETYGKDNAAVTACRNNLGSAWQAKGEYDQAINYYQQALTSNLKTFGEEHPWVASGRNNLGSVWYDKGDYDQAIDFFSQALASDLKSFGKEHPHVAIDRNNLGSALYSKGDYNQAIDYFKLALASDLKSFGQSHPNVARDLSNLGSVWRSKGDICQAIYNYKQALAIFNRKLGPDHPQTKTVANYLARVRRESN